MFFITRNTKNNHDRNIFLKGRKYIHKKYKLYNNKIIFLDIISSKKIKVLLIDIPRINTKKK